MAENSNVENPLLDDGEMIRKLEEVKQNITEEIGDVKLVYGFGLAYEEQVDRARFNSLIKYLVNEPIEYIKYSNLSLGNYYRMMQREKNVNVRTGGASIKMSTQRKTHIVCFDPNFDNHNIEILLDNIEYVLGDIFNFEKEKKKTHHYIFKFQRKGSSLGEPIELNVYFFRYALKTKEDFTSGECLNRQLLIQGILPGQAKTSIKNYVEDERCSYESGTFYNVLEKIALHEKVKNIYVASAFNSHDRLLRSVSGYTILEYNRNARGLVKSDWFICNRYFENTCEILTLLHKIYSQGKKVYFIELDNKFHSFQHPTIEYKKSPYSVPFDESTQFYIDHPKRFYKVRPMETWPSGWASGSVVIPTLEGGGKKTRGHKNKRKAQTKRRKPKA